MNVNVINESENIFQSVIENLVYQGCDYSKNLVIFPGKRPSYFLLEEIRKKTCKPFIPPTIFSIDEFIDYCYEKEAKVLDKKIDALSGCKVIRDLIQRNGIYDKYVKNLNRFLPLGLKLFSAFEELLIEHVTKQKLREQDYKIDANFIKDTLIRLSDVYENFYKYLESNNLSTRSLRYKKVSETELTISNYDKIILAGFFALSESERTIFKNFSLNERVIFIFQGKSANIYAFEKIYTPPLLNVKNIELYECPDTHSEVFQLSNLLVSDIKEKGDAKNFLVISPSPDTLVPLINSINLNLEEYNVSIGYPLLRTPLYSFIQHIFDTLSSMEGEKIYVPDYLRFVLHPYTKNILYKNKAEITRIIFHKIEERLVQQKFINYRALSDIESDDLLKEIWALVKEEIAFSELKKLVKDIHENTIRQFQTIKNIKEFAIKIKLLVNYIYEKSTAKRHILFFPYCEAMLDALTEIENSLFAEDSFDNNSEYFVFFKKFISLYKVPFKGTPIKDIQVLGFLESRNLKFDNVYILDLNEGIVPDSEREDSILPFDVRKALGLPTYIEKDNLFDYYLKNIIASAKKTVIFYVENDNKDKSRFVEKIIWEKQKITKDLEGKYFQTVSYKFTLTPRKPREVIKSPSIKESLKNMSYSASSLDTYFLCPVKFYFQYVLLPREEEVYEDIESKDVGNLTHELLKHYFDDKKIAFDEQKFSKILDDTFQKVFGKELKGQVLIIKHQIKEKLIDFIKRYPDIVGTEDINIIDLERRFETQATIAGVGDININGRIDRIEKRKGKIFILDYKTSSNENKYKVRWDTFDLKKRDEWQKAFQTVQLIFYIYLLKLSKVYNVDNAGIILLGKKDTAKCEIKLFNNEAELQNIIHIDTIITTLLKEILTDDLFKPTDDQKTCKNCSYIDVCWR